MPTRTTAAVLLAACALLAGCSSSSDDKAPSTPTTATGASSKAPTSSAPDNATSALESAVRAYSAAYFKPDPKAAAALLSDRCRSQISAAVYGAQLKAAAKNFGPQPIKTLKVDQISGDLARVSYTYAVPGLNQADQPWTREHGKWHYDAC